METPSKDTTTTSMSEGMVSCSRRESFLEQVCNQDTESEEVVCALVDNLTEAEMGMLESYSDRLMEAGVTEEDAYQLSFDSFIKGVESYHAYNKRLSFSTANVIPTTASTSTVAPLTTAAPKMHLRWNEDGERVRTEVPRRETIAYYGASLRSLFSVDDYTQTQGEKDAELVSFYADEMTKDGGIDSDVAYGVALDSFLSDPEVFRKQMRKLGAPLNLFMQGDNETKAPEQEEAAATDDAMASIVNADEEAMLVVDNTEVLDELRAALEDVIVLPAPAVTATPRRTGRRLVNTPATVKTDLTRARKATPATKAPLAVTEAPISAAKLVVVSVPEVSTTATIQALASSLPQVVAPEKVAEEATVDIDQSADLNELRAALYEAVPTVTFTSIATPRRSGRKLVSTPTTVKTATRGRKSTVTKMAPLPVIVAVEEPVSALKPVAEVASTVAASATEEALEEVAVNKETVSTEAAPAVKEVEVAVTVELETVHVDESPAIASSAPLTIDPVEESVAILASEPVDVAVIDDVVETTQISTNLSVSIEEPVSSIEQPAVVLNKRGRKKASVDEPTTAPIEQPTPKRGRSAASKPTTITDALPLPSITAPTPAKVGKATKIPIVVVEEVEEEAEAESEGEELVILCDGQAN